MYWLFHDTAWLVYTKGGSGISVSLSDELMQHSLKKFELNRRKIGCMCSSCYRSHLLLLLTSTALSVHRFYRVETRKDVCTISVSHLFRPASVFFISVVNFRIMVSVRTGGDSLDRSLNHPMHYRHVLPSFLTNQVKVVRKESVASDRSPVGCTGHGPKNTEYEWIHDITDMSPLVGD